MQDFMAISNKYAVVDLETTGNYGDANRITEIAILITDGKQVIDRFSSLVNPERRIPSYISGLTGITDDMVANAPKFYEIAKEVYQLMEECVFVAHNVSFDSSVLKFEYESLGGTFNPKKLCTVRLSRKCFTGLKSYSLGNLCESLGIPLKDRHRAMGDAEATTLLFHKIIEEQPELIGESLNARRKEATLPPNVERSHFEELPNRTGVYYFLNENREIIYVGKAIDIKKRVYSHFLKKDNRSKTQNFRRSIHFVDYTITGSELVALLHESAEIKKHLPVFNRAQRRTSFPFGIYAYENNAGYMQLMINRVKNAFGKAIAVYPNMTDARNHLFKIQEEFELCPKLCGLQKVNKACFDYQINRCKGACIKKEDPELYNERVYKLMERYANNDGSFVVIDKGRKREEKSVVLVEKGVYKGFGYVEESEQINSFESFADFIKPKTHNRDIERILSMQLKKQSYKIIYPS